MDLNKTSALGAEIESKLNALAVATQVDGGIWRALGTETDRIGKRLIKEWFEEAGLEVHEDNFSNIFGRIEGEVKETILVGSHIDTVKDGGKYDGACGVVTALCVLKALKENGWKPYYSVEVVGIEEEEGSRFEMSYPGSHAIVGKLNQEDLKTCDDNGISLRKVLEDLGKNPEKIEEADRRKDVREYIELHVEQGQVLDRENINIGLVENIVGMDYYDITIHGEQNHAGTTPMYMRKDPMVRMASLITELESKIRSVSDNVVITFGKMYIHPGVGNVIPSHVTVVIDMRAAKAEDLLASEEILESCAMKVKEDGFGVECVRTSHEMPVPLNQEMISSLEEAVKEAGVTYKRMNSGAGHDAMIIAPEIPTCMIFIPSVNGISHSPKEYTRTEDLGRGADVLLRLLVKRAK